jgi:CubicO group peptidase (beta-lactamase class C family)
MRFIIMIASVFVLLTTALSQSQQESFQNRITNWRTAQNVSGIAAVTITPQQTTFITDGITWAGSSIPFTQHSPVIIGSTAKALSAIIALQLSQEGKLHLDQPIASWIPEFKTWQGYGQRLTLRHLLTHRGGIPQFFNSLNGEFNGTLSSLAKNLSKDSRLVEPNQREGWYSNAGYTLAALMIERVTGQDFEHVVYDRILKPLKLEDAGFINTQYAPVEKPSGHLELFGTNSVTAVFGREYVSSSSTLAMSISDVSRYLQAILNNAKNEQSPLLDRSSFTEMLRFQNMVRTPGGLFSWDWKLNKYALGWFMGTIENTPIYAHLGSTGTSSSYFLFAPQKGIAVGILVNHSREQPLEELGQDIAKILFEQR